MVFDSLDPVLPDWARRVQRWLVQAVCGAAMLGLAWLLWQAGADFLANGETTAQLRIPKGFFIQGMGVLCAFTGLVHLSLMVGAEQQEQEGGVL